MIFNVPGHIELIRNGLFITATKPYLRKHQGGSLSTLIKTQTRRVNRGIYKVGKDYAVQRKRGVKAEPDIRIVMDRIWHEFNIISVEDAKAEGRYSPAEYELLFRELNPNWDETRGRWAFEFHVVTKKTRCPKCGRFVGKDGFIDVSYDDYMGGYEEGYFLCARCLQKEKARIGDRR